MRRASLKLWDRCQGSKWVAILEEPQVFLLSHSEEGITHSKVFRACKLWRVGRPTIQSVRSSKMGGKSKEPCRSFWTESWTEKMVKKTLKVQRVDANIYKIDSEPYQRSMGSTQEMTAWSKMYWRRWLVQWKYQRLQLLQTIGIVSPYLGTVKPYRRTDTTCGRQKLRRDKP